jgi:hypothetical protein
MYNKRWKKKRSPKAQTTPVASFGPFLCPCRPFQAPGHPPSRCRCRLPHCPPHCHCRCHPPRRCRPPRHCRPPRCHLRGSSSSRIAVGWWLWWPFVVRLWWLWWCYMWWWCVVVVDTGGDGGDGGDGGGDGGDDGDGDGRDGDGRGRWWWSLTR